LVEITLGCWCQGKGFKHGVERWGINQLDGRKTAKYLPDSVTPNPARRRLDRELRLTRVEEGKARRKFLPCGHGLRKGTNINSWFRPVGPTSPSQPSGVRSKSRDFLRDENPTVRANALVLLCLASGVVIMAAVGCGVSKEKTPTSRQDPAHEPASRPSAATDARPCVGASLSKALKRWKVRLPDGQSGVRPAGSSSTPPAWIPSVFVGQQALSTGGRSLAAVSGGRLQSSVVATGVAKVIPSLLASLRPAFSRQRGWARKRKVKHGQGLVVAADRETRFHLLHGVLRTTFKAGFSTYYLLARGNVGIPVVATVRACRPPTGYPNKTKETLELRAVVNPTGLCLQSRHGSECPPGLKRHLGTCFAVTAGQYSGEVLRGIRNHLHTLFSQKYRGDEHYDMPENRHRIALVVDAAMKMDALMAIFDTVRPLPLPKGQKKTVRCVARWDYRHQRYGYSYTDGNRSVREVACMYDAPCLFLSGGDGLPRRSRGVKSVAIQGRTTEKQKMLRALAETTLSDGTTTPPRRPGPMGPKPKSRISAFVPPPRLAGAVASQLRAAIRRQVAQLRGCHEKAIDRSATVRGLAKITIVLSPGGKVTSVRLVSGLPASLQRCVEKRIRQWKLPAPRVRLSYGDFVVRFSLR